MQGLRESFLLWWFWVARNHFQEVFNQKDCPLGKEDSCLSSFAALSFQMFPSVLPALGDEGWTLHTWQAA